MPKLRIKRQEKGLLKKSPAIVLAGNKYHEFYPGDQQEINLPAGVATVSINKTKYLSFEIGEEETKEFEIAESIFEINFLLRYGILSLLVLFLVYYMIWETIKGHYFSQIFGTLILTLIVGFFVIRGIARTYFYLQEQ